MRVTFVLDNFGRGGKERRCLQLIQGLNKKGFHDIQVILINDDIIKYEELFDTSAKIEFVRRKQNQLSYLQSLKRTRRLLSDFNPDIVMSWGGISGVIMACLKPFIKAVCLSAFVADTIQVRPFTCGWFIRKLIIGSNKFIVGNSQAGLDAYGVPFHKGVKIVNGFNRTRFDIGDLNKEDLKKDLSVSTKYLVVMISRYTRIHKDYQAFIDAAKRIVKDRDDVTFLGIGPGKDRNYYISQLTEDDKKRIRLLGKRDDVEKVLTVADISMLFSNLNAGEGISNTILESLAFGVPVIATWAGGTPEIIENGENGFMVKGNDLGIIVETTNKLLENNKLYEKISENGKKTVTENFSLDKMTDRYLHLFGRCL